MPSFRSDFPKYWEIPDGTNCVGKAWLTTRIGGTVGEHRRGPGALSPRPGPTPAASRVLALPGAGSLLRPPGPGPGPARGAARRGGKQPVPPQVA